MFLIALVEMALMAGAAVLISYILLLPLQLAIRPKGPNRYGARSPTRHIGSAIAGGLRHAFDFSSRAGLVDFWGFAVFVGVVCFAAFFTVLMAIVMKGEAGAWIAAPTLIVSILAVPSLSIAVRRLHDVNRSGWWLLALCVGGILTLLYWFVQPSQSDAPDKAAIFA